MAPGEFLQYWHDETTPATIGRRRGNRGGFSANTVRHSKIKRVQAGFSKSFKEP
jgi:hypothetical protein